jgi:hypothetical protein
MHKPGVFRGFLGAVEPVRMRDPLAWMKRVRWIVLEERDREAWLTVETREV